MFLSDLNPPVDFVGGFVAIGEEKELSAWGCCYSGKGGGLLLCRVEGRVLYGIRALCVREGDGERDAYRRAAPSFHWMSLPKSWNLRKYFPAVSSGQSLLPWGRPLPPRYRCAPSSVTLVGSVDVVKGSERFPAPGRSRIPLPSAVGPDGAAGRARVLRKNENEINVRKERNMIEIAGQTRWKKETEVDVGKGSSCRSR